MAGLKDGVIKRGRSWSYVIRVTDPLGISRPRWVGGFPSEAAAKEARDNARIAARRGQYVDKSTITVGQYLRQWLDSHALEVKPSTHAGYEYLLTKYVVPALGKTRLQTLRPTALSDLYKTLLEEGGQGGRPLSVRTVQLVHAALRKALGDAVRTDQLLASNPAERAKRPRSVRDHVAEGVWSAAQLRAFLDRASSHRLFAFYRLAAYSGARRGELLNLRWADVTLDHSPRIRIRGTVGLVAGGTRYEGTTKSGRERVVNIDSGTATVLREHLARQELDRARAGGSWVAGDWVFRKEIGTPIHPSTATALMRSLLADYNKEHPDGRVPVIRLHDLRHTHATLLLRVGVPVHVVAARLGHADPAITLRVYAHVLGDQAAEVADAFAQAVDNDEDGRPGRGC